MEPISNPSTTRRSTSSKGVALVIVLCLLVLISGIVVAFFSSVSSEYLTAKSASTGASSKELADAAVQLVMGQIRQATSQGSNICWASQPGMIRTWGDHGNVASANKLGFYKLYSSGTMVVDASSGNFTPEDDIPAATWANQPALYTDLNAPMMGSSGTTVYPIVDPTAADTVNSGTNSLVEGFSIITDGSHPAPIGTSGNRAPMPVRWIYVLRDGSMLAPDASSSGTLVTFTSGTKTPTATNPIVGRVAFWSDDETCKLNLNTACGGAYWEQPMFSSDMDLAFSRYKPVNGEYNRYPGHPATTSLLPVFWSYAGLTSPYENLFPSLLNSTHTMNFDLKPYFDTTGTTAFQSILQLSPRNQWGGSMMSTVATQGYGVTTGTTPISLDSDRLYASVDEAIFGYATRGSGTSGGAVNALSWTSNQLDKDQIKKLRFFLTTSSKSPETNPFNKPKIGIWPVPEQTGTAYRSPADRLIAFCSTLTGASGTNVYYFTRNLAQSGTSDWLPGGRNDKIFDSLDSLLQKSMPGFGASFDSRYSVAGGRRILTLIYDYIRSTINLMDTSFGTDSSGFYKNTFMGNANDYTGYGFGQVVPIQISKGDTNYKGIGRFPLIKQVAVMFMVRAANQPPIACYPNGRPIIYDISHTVISDTNGNILPASYPTVFGGSAFARLNLLHPWVSGTFTDSLIESTYVSQFKDTAGNPVMAISSTDANPSDPTVFFPVFGTGVKDVISNSNIAKITNSTTPSASGFTQYPTLYSIMTDGTSGYWGVMASTTGTISVSGSSYTYAKAAFPPTPANQLNAPQTHAGMPYLTVQSPFTIITTTTVSGVVTTATSIAGAFTVPNPRYQGKHLYPNYELPDPANLPPGSTEMQAAFLLDPVNVAPGNTPLIPKYQVKVSGLDWFAAGGHYLGFVSPATQANQKVTAASTTYHNLNMQTISIGMGWYGVTRTSVGTDQNNLSWIGTPVIVSGNSFSFTGGTIRAEMYASPVLSGTSAKNNPVPIVTTGSTASSLVQTYNIEFPSTNFPTPLLPVMPSGQAGAQGYNELLSGTTGTYNACNDPGPYSNTSSAFLQQQNGNYVVPPNVPSRIPDLVPSSLLTSDAANSLSRNPNIGVGSLVCPITTTSGSTYTTITTSYCADGGLLASGNSGVSGKSRFCYGAGNDTATVAYFLPQRNGYPKNETRVKLNGDTIRSVECLYGDPRVFASLPIVGPEFFKPHRFYYDLDMRGAHTFRGAIFGQYPDSSRNSSSNFRGASDHSLSDAYVFDASWNYNPWTNNGTNASLLGRTPGDKIAQLAGYSANAGQNGGIRSQAPYTTSSSELNDGIFAATQSWNGVTRFTDIWKVGGDFSNGVGSEPDGPYINKPNEAGGLLSASSTTVSYYPEWWDNTGNKVFTLDSQFSPNRLICSPVAFGSLPAPSPLNSSPGTPSPVDAWHTLLFCPNPNASSFSLYTTRMDKTDVTLPNQVPTGSKCPDHLLLDFFFMPVVEPYAISEPFSTAGKVNMNYQIAPFTYIRRSTALSGVLRGTMLTAVNDQFVPSKTGYEESYYKSNIMNFGIAAVSFATAADTYGKFLAESANWGFRYPIHAGETLKQFQQRFDKGDIFRSPSEICSLFLYPAKQPKSATDPANPLVQWDSESANIKSWWYDDPAGARKSLTGDNERERPYDTIYPRLTTKSNSYTVHFRVQMLKQDTSDSTKLTRWVENPARIVSEYRGSTLIERYVDPNDPSLPDFATTTTTTSDTLDQYYKFRIVNTKKFTAE